MPGLEAYTMHSMEKGVKRCHTLGTNIDDFIRGDSNRRPSNDFVD